MSFLSVVNLSKAASMAAFSVLASTTRKFFWLSGGAVTCWAWLSVLGCPYDRGGIATHPDAGQKQTRDGILIIGATISTRSRCRTPGRRLPWASCSPRPRSQPGTACRGSLPATPSRLRMVGKGGNRALGEKACRQTFQVVSLELAQSILALVLVVRVRRVFDVGGSVAEPWG